MVAVAIGGAAVLGAGASIISGNKAAKAQTKAADKSAEVQKYMYDTTRSDYEPWRAAGNTALTALMNLYGLPTNGVTTSGVQSTPETIAAQNGGTGEGTGFFGSGFILDHIGDRIARGETIPPKLLAFYNRNRGGTTTPATGTTAPAGATATPPAPYGGLQTSPGYEWRRDQGIQAIDRSASARGLRRSGGTAMAVMRYADGLASSEYGDYASRLAQLAGFGQSATAGTAQAGQNYANGAAAAYTNAGNARASSYANTGSAINSGLNNVMSAYMFSQSPWGKS